MPTDKHLDYLQASTNTSIMDMSAKTTQEIPPVAFYRKGFRDAFGTRFFFGNVKSKKALVIMSGDALQNLRNDGYTDNDIVLSLAEKQGKFTRIDHAITQWNESDPITFDDIQTWYKEEKIKSPLCERGMKVVASFDREDGILPETLYIGDLKKRGKKGIFRAYDKGLQLDISRYLITRFELEERGDNAHNSAMRIAHGSSCESVMRSRFDIEDKRWQGMMNAEKVDISRGMKKEKIMSEEESRWRWLIEQVAPSLKKAIETETVDISQSQNFTEFCRRAGLKSKIVELAKFLAENSELK